MRWLALPLCLLLAGQAVSAPALRLPSLVDGHPVDLQQWRGRVVLLNFWASWCAPCQAEIRKLVRFQEQFAARGLQVVGVGLGEPKGLRNVARSLEINYPLLVREENEQQLLKRWGERSGIIPYSVVLNGEGEVVYRHRGIFDDEVFRDQVLPLLQ